MEPRPALTQGEASKRSSPALHSSSQSHSVFSPVRWRPGLSIRPCFIVSARQEGERYPWLTTSSRVRRASEGNRVAVRRRRMLDCVHRVLELLVDRHSCLTRVTPLRRTSKRMRPRSSSSTLKFSALRPSGDIQAPARKPRAYALAVGSHASHHRPPETLGRTPGAAGLDRPKHATRTLGTTHSSVNGCHEIRKPHRL